MRRRVSAALFLFAAMTSSAYALDVEQALALLMDKALAVHITARVTENGKQTIWNMNLSEVTISGRAVSVKLNGSNIVVVAQFTPYRESGKQLLLVAQGQTWITSPVNKEVKYSTTFKSLPINLGDKVLFYPLGVNLQTEKYGNINIELEIRVVPYVTEKKNDNQQKDKQSSGSKDLQKQGSASASSLKSESKSSDSSLSGPQTIEKNSNKE